MFEFVQALEQRMLFTVSSATLTADYSSIVSDAAAVRAAFNTKHKDIISDLAGVRAALKGAKSSDTVKLLAEMTTDNARDNARDVVAQTQLLTKGEILSLKAELDGKALLKNPSNTKLAAKVSADATAITNTIPSLANALETDDNTLGSQVSGDLSSLETANPGNTALTAAVTKTDTDGGNNADTYFSDISQFKTATGTMASDVGTLVV